MYSKKLTLYLFISIFVVTGCGLKTGEQKRVQEVAELKSTSCMKPSMKQLSAFFDGVADEEKLGLAFDCLQNVLIAFKDNMRGKSKDSYSPGEIASFLKNNILKDDTDFSPELLAAAMKLKVLFVGGNTEFITKPELEATSSFVARLKPEVVRMNAHMPIMLSQWKPEGEQASNEEKFYQAKRNVGISMTRIAQILASTGRPYEINDFMNFVYEVVKMSDGKSDSLKKINSARSLLTKYKINLIGGNSALVGAEWTRFASSLTEIYFQALRYKYFIEKLRPDQTDDRLKQYENILADVLKLLPDLLQENGSGQLTNLQIGEIINAAKEVLPSLDVSPELIEQVGKFKLVLVGKFGNGHESWSPADFKTLANKLPDLMNTVRVAVKSLKQYKINRTGFRNNEIKHEDFLQAESELLVVVHKFSSQLLYSYDLQDMKKLILAAKPLLKDSVSFPENLDDLFEMVYTAKVAMTGEKGPQLTIKNMQLILNVGINLYGNFIEFTNFVVPFKIYEKEFTKNVEPWVLKLRESVASLLNLKNSHELTTEEVSALVLTAQKAKYLDTKIQKKGLDSALNAIWNNILNKPEDRLADKLQTSFTALSLANLSVEIMYWIDNQKTIFNIFDQRPEFSKEEVVQQIKAKLDETKSLLTKASLAELYKVVSASGLMNYNEKDYLRILTPQNGIYHVKDIAFSNLGKSFARLFIRSFGKDLQRIQDYSGVTVAEARAGFDLIKDLLCDLEYIDREDSDTFVESRFREASLFLATSDGNDFLDLKEVHHLFLHIMSGVTRAETYRVTAEKKCMKVKNPENPPRSELDEECLMNMTLEEDATFLDLPEFLKLKTEKTEDGQPRFTPEANKQYYLSLLKAAGHVQNERSTVFVSDAVMFPHVVQYIEAIYARHDANVNTLFEKEEALRAYPIFDNLITTLSKPFTMLKPADMPGVFIYLLKFHKPPKTLAEKLKFANFVKDHDCADGKPCQKEWNIQSTRHDLGMIFNFIADATKPPPPTPTPPTPPPTGGQ